MSKDWWLQDDELAKDRYAMGLSLPEEFQSEMKRLGYLPEEIKREMASLEQDRANTGGLCGG